MLRTKRGNSISVHSSRRARSTPFYDGDDVVVVERPWHRRHLAGRLFLKLRPPRFAHVTRRKRESANIRRVGTQQRPLNETPLAAFVSMKRKQNRIDWLPLHNAFQTKNRALCVVGKKLRSTSWPYLFQFDAGG